MFSVFWLAVVLFLIGFLHGLHSDHVEEILARYDREHFYLQMARISLEEILDHLRLFGIVLLPLVLLQLVIPGLKGLGYLIAIAFLCFAAANIYLFFFQKVSLHQHGHDHSHAHGHGHEDISPPAEEHSHPDEDGHEHPLPGQMDRPEEEEDHHSHDHDHSHNHLHIHHEDKVSKHQHQHYPGILGRILELRNLSVLFLLAAVIIVFPLTAGGITVVFFLLGTYLSIYLLSLIYIAGGIRLMEKCISFSDLLSGAAALLVLFFI
jgi:hypothetical protein